MEDFCGYVIKETYNIGIYCLKFVNVQYSNVIFKMCAYLGQQITGTFSSCMSKILYPLRNSSSLFLAPGPWQSPFYSLFP